MTYTSTTQQVGTVVRGSIRTGLLTLAMSVGVAVLATGCAPLVGTACFSGRYRVLDEEDHADIVAKEER